jgi:hypothetical protein
MRFNFAEARQLHPLTASLAAPPAADVDLLSDFHRAATSRANPRIHAKNLGTDDTFLGAVVRTFWIAAGNVSNQVEHSFQRGNLASH